ncbi:MAG: transcription elongation factor GreA [Actinomycetota bacterium]|nr:transcription elongation factor GreA [Actinomycetota bacterium]
MSDSETPGESITAEGMAQLEAEIRELEGPARERISERLKVAIAEGDLKENAEYHIAKEDQSHLETRILRLRERQKNAVVVDVDEDSRQDVFAFGRTAEVTDPNGKRHTWTLVGSTEADLAGGKLSAESPVGQALRDKAVGSEVKIATPKGERIFKVEKIV